MVLYQKTCAVIIRNVFVCKCIKLCIIYRFIIFAGWWPEIRNDELVEYLKGQIVVWCQRMEYDLEIKDYV